MVFKALSAGASGDLNNFFDNYGFFDDTVLVLDRNFYSIKTYEGNDTINCARPTANDLHQVWCGAGNDTFIGGSDRDMVHDGSGNDNIALGDGDDSLTVGSGNDVYVGGSGEDSVAFGATTDDGFGSTAVSVNLTFDLAVTGSQNLGVYGSDRFSGFESIFGSGGNERFFGNSAANRINGNAGNDLIDGRSGADTLSGGNGIDTMIGGAGADFFDLTDFGFRDTVRYLALKDSGTAMTTRDTIAFFKSGGTATDDKIDLSAIDARPTLAGNQAFLFRGTGSFTSGAGEVRIVAQPFGCVVQIDTDADSAPEMTIFMQNNTTLKAFDFVL